MTDALSMRWSDAFAREREATYRKAFGFNLALQLVIGLCCLLAPTFVCHLFGAAPPQPIGWMRGWGALLILVAALCFPGLQSPMRSRYPNIVGIVGRAWTGLAWLFIARGFVWLGLVDLSFAIILGWLFYRACIAEIMNRP
jgi:hypothetical protein